MRNRLLAYTVALASGLIGAVIPSGPLDAQATRTIRGRAIAGETGDALPGVVIAALGDDGLVMARAITGATGAFVLQAPRRTTRVTAVRIGFRPHTLVVGPSPDTTLVFALRPASLLLDPVIVAGEPSFSAASSSAIRDLDIHLRPRASAQEILTLAPGLVIAQHGGGGKAEQIFLRGFDADHGTDVAISVDGTPVNLVSHAHGQGYADLHFLIPEVVARADVRKGPFDARDGDFATAGSVELTTQDRVEDRLVDFRFGAFGTSDLVALVPFGGDVTRSGGYVALARRATRGPFDVPQDFRRHNGFAKWTVPLTSRVQLVTSASAFGARWHQSGQIPERAVGSGLIGRFGSIDPSEGGATERQDVAVGLRSTGVSDAGWLARMYATRYRLRLFSNFTFFLADSANGDGIEQVDDRVVLGAHGHYTADASVLGRRARWSAGAGVRSDAADVALHRQRGRARLDTVNAARVSQQHVHAWHRLELALSRRVRANVSARGDLFRFDVRDRVAGVSRHPAWRGIVSPRANVAIDVTRGMTLFVNAGGGFHSNDARDVVNAEAGEQVLPRAVSGEVGLRRAWRTGSIAMALWRLDLESELVWVGDEGSTEPNGRTRRVGVDLELRARLAPWLWIDADLNLARARFRDAPAGEDHVALAPTATSTGGLTVRDAGPLGAGVRYRSVGPRAADEQAVVRARGSTVWEFFASWRIRGATLSLAVDNLFNVEWNEAQFATTSRLRGEASPVTELHFTPGSPRRMELDAEIRF